MRRTSRSTMVLLSGWLLLAAWPGTSGALESDRKQPVHIQADQVEIDQKSGTSTYQGNVELEQGTLHIHADRLTVYTKQSRLERLVAEGDPVTYRQRPDGRAQDVEASARTMEYRTDRDTVVLTEQARLQQGDNTFSSDRIVYNRRSDQVEAGGRDKGGRVHITIEPGTDSNTGK